MNSTLDFPFQTQSQGCFRQILNRKSQSQKEYLKHTVETNK